MSSERKFWVNSDGAVLVDSNGRPFFTTDCCCSSSENEACWCTSNDGYSGRLVYYAYPERTACWNYFYYSSVSSTEDGVSRYYTGLPFFEVSRYGINDEMDIRNKAASTLDVSALESFASATGSDFYDVLQSAYSSAYNSISSTVRLSSWICYASTSALINAVCNDTGSYHRLSVVISNRYGTSALWLAEYPYCSSLFVSGPYVYDSATTTLRSFDLRGSLVGSWDSDVIMSFTPESLLSPVAIRCGPITTTIAVEPGKYMKIYQTALSSFPSSYFASIDVLCGRVVPAVASTTAYFNHYYWPTEVDVYVSNWDTNFELNPEYGSMKVYVRPTGYEDFNSLIQSRPLSYIATLPRWSKYGSVLLNYRFSIYYAAVINVHQYNVGSPGERGWPTDYIWGMGAHFQPTPEGVQECALAFPERRYAAYAQRIPDMGYGTYFYSAHIADGCVVCPSRGSYRYLSAPRYYQTAQLTETPGAELQIDGPRAFTSMRIDRYAYYDELPLSGLIPQIAFAASDLCSHYGFIGGGDNFVCTDSFFSVNTAVTMNVTRGVISFASLINATFYCHSHFNPLGVKYFRQQYRDAYENNALMRRFPRLYAHNWFGSMLPGTAYDIDLHPRRSYQTRHYANYKGQVLYMEDKYASATEWIPIIHGGALEGDGIADALSALIGKKHGYKMYMIVSCIVETTYPEVSMTVSRNDEIYDLHIPAGTSTSAVLYNFGQYRIDSGVIIPLRLRALDYRHSNTTKFTSTIECESISLSSTLPYTKFASAWYTNEAIPANAILNDIEELLLCPTYSKYTRFFSLEEAGCATSTYSGSHSYVLNNPDGRTQFYSYSATAFMYTGSAQDYGYNTFFVTFYANRITEYVSKQGNVVTRADLGHQRSNLVCSNTDSEIVVLPVTEQVIEASAYFFILPELYDNNSQLPPRYSGILLSASAFHKCFADYAICAHPEILHSREGIPYYTDTLPLVNGSTLLYSGDKTDFRMELTGLAVNKVITAISARGSRTDITVAHVYGNIDDGTYTREGSYTSIYSGLATVLSSTNSWSSTKPWSAYAVRTVMNATFCFDINAISYNFIIPECSAQDIYYAFECDSPNYDILGKHPAGSGYQRTSRTSNSYSAHIELYDVDPDAPSWYISYVEDYRAYFQTSCIFTSCPVPVVLD